jgi:alanyl-tRNA synthetase
MQQFKPYYLNEESPYGLNVASCQKCFRTSDIDEVGDERHLTFFEMLGNFSFGGYFKKEAIYLAKEFLDSINIKIDYVTVFEGDKDIPFDKECEKIWGELGFSQKNKNLFLKNREENFWGPVGEEGPCGPTTEIYSSGIEIWNLVFNEFYQDKEKKLYALEKKGVDTGMGFERLLMVVSKKSNVFETDLFSPIIDRIRAFKPDIKSIENYQKNERIIADHIKAAVFLASEGVVPSNIEEGYILRRLLRRAIRVGKVLNLPSNFLIPLVEEVCKIYQDVYSEIQSAKSKILDIISKEESKFEKTIERGLRQFEKIGNNRKISGEDAFHLYDTYGFPIELILELAKEKNWEVDIEGFKKCYTLHKEISRAGAKSKFGGHGLKQDSTGPAVKLHTATHLLHAALRKILGDNVRQMGSDITSERTRFDFSYHQKLTPQQIKEIEDLVNQKIKESLEVKKEQMPLKKAIESGALAFFKEKYPEVVTVYSIGDFSREICGGPHVKNTSELGVFKIVREESLGSGVRRIRAILE